MAETPTVLVTGITGFVGSWTARELLSRGFKVRGTLRSLKKKDEVIAKVAPAGTADLLSFVEV
jgi:dihydroflavonol-4-reductase